MEYRRLGKSGLSVSVVGFGGHQSGGYRGQFRVPPAERASVIQRALELGITYFDTTMAGEVASLGQAFQALGGKPESVTVACMYTDYKLNHDIVAGIEQRVSESIEANLRHFDPIDVFNLCGNGFAYSAERTRRAVDALLAARDRGRVRHFGFSTHTLAYARSMIANHPEFTLVMFPFNRVLPKVAERLLPLAAQSDVAVVGMKAFAARGFFDLDLDPERFGAGLSLAGAAIGWVLRHPEVACTIPAMNSIAEVEENAAAAGRALTPADEELLDALDAAFALRVEQDPTWYFHRDWTRRLYGEESEPAAISG